jgi:8-oxo-dGTP pyrophosphatase MutT (NUDIX family)
LVHDVFGHWTLSKGKLKDGESPEEGTKREVNEEIGIDVEIIEELDDNEYIANYPQKGKTRKQVTYFLAEAKYQPLELGESEGLDDAEWFEVNEDILDLNFYDDILPIVSKAVKKLTREEHNN